MDGQPGKIHLPLVASPDPAVSVDQHIGEVVAGRWHQAVQKTQPPQPGHHPADRTLELAGAEGGDALLAQGCAYRVLGQTGHLSPVA